MPNLQFPVYTLISGYYTLISGYPTLKSGYLLVIYECPDFRVHTLKSGKGTNGYIDEVQKPTFKTNFAKFYKENYKSYSRKMLYNIAISDFP